LITKELLQACVRSAKFGVEREDDPKMTFWKITQHAEVEVSRFSDLLAAWRQYGFAARYRMTAPLTASQTAKLPTDLRERLD
jgi:hypothetical protein